MNYELRITKPGGADWQDRRRRKVRDLCASPGRVEREDAGFLVGIMGCECWVMSEKKLQVTSYELQKRRAAQ